MIGPGLPQASQSAEPGKAEATGRKDPEPDTAPADPASRKTTRGNRLISIESLRVLIGDIRTPWLTYFLKAPQQQENRLENEIERERVILGDLPELSVQILEIAQDHGSVTISEATKATGTSRNTVKDHIKALTEKGRLARRGAGRGTWYTLV